ncbi:MAG: formylglycine-generating enzyme family protein [Pseudomonadota bacterium]
MALTHLSIRRCLWLTLALLAACSKDAADKRSPVVDEHGLEWIVLDGGCFVMGADNAYPDEAPRREVCVDSFQIMTTEVTTAQYAAFVTATGYQTRAETGWSADDEFGPGVAMPPGSAVFSVPKTANPATLNWWRYVNGASWQRPAGPDGPQALPDHPVVHVTRTDAEAFARWAGGRLPTEEEWEFAAAGKADGDPRKSPDGANVWQGLFPLANSRRDGYEGTAPVGRFEPNANGLYDMIGNVWEWTASPYTPSHSDADRNRAGPNGLDPAQPGVPVGSVKGGSYLCSTSYCIRFRAPARQAQDLQFGTSHIGFRLVRVP